MKYVYATNVSIPGTVGKVKFNIVKWGLYPGPGIACVHDSVLPKLLQSGCVEISREDYDKAMRGIKIVVPSCHSIRKSFRPLAVVLAYHSKDIKLCMRLLEWIAELGKNDNQLFLISGRSSTEAEDDLVQSVAKNAFSVVNLIKQHVGDELGWPGAPNAMFGAAASYMAANLQTAWLWLEPDCVFLKPDALGTLQKEYYAAGKRYMGAIQNKFLAGVAVYPRDAYKDFALHVKSTTIPWDVLGGDAILKQSHITNLIQHEWGESGSAPPVFKDLSRIRPEAVLFHRCKDGSLIDVLASARQSSPRMDVQKAKQTTESHKEEQRKAEPSDDKQDKKVVQPRIAVDGIDWTIIVTSYNRQHLLRRAIESCSYARGAHVIITSTSTSDAAKAAERSYASKHDVLAFGNRLSANASWLAGACKAKTKMVTILHDDDVITPAAAEAVTAALANGCDLVRWATTIGPQRDRIWQETMWRNGCNRSSQILCELCSYGQLAVSPVSGAYRQDVCVEALKEAEDNLGSEFEMRKGFVVGNDLLLWLRAAERSNKVWYSDDPGCNFGTEESTTAKEKHNGFKTLLAFYDRLREYYFSTHKVRMRNLLDGAKICVMCYLPPRSYPGFRSFIQNISDAKPSLPVLWYSDEPTENSEGMNIGDVIKVAGTSQLDGFRNLVAYKSIIAAHYFFEGIRLASSMGYDYAINLEADCRVSAGWDVKIIEEFSQWPWPAAFAGSPMIWRKSRSGEAVERSIDEYIKDHKIANPPSIISDDGNGGASLYPNGALAVYDVQQVLRIFRRYKKDWNQTMTAVAPYDAEIGRNAIISWAHNATRFVCPLPSVHSTYATDITGDEARMNLLKAGKVVAVHPIKSDTI